MKRIKTVVDYDNKDLEIAITDWDIYSGCRSTLDSPAEPATIDILDIEALDKNIVLSEDAKDSIIEENHAYFEELIFECVEEQI